ncbi:MAG: hypothetical protein AAGD92_06555 [Pseudomonadota bacterium]
MLASLRRFAFIAFDKSPDIDAEVRGALVEARELLSDMDDMEKARILALRALFRRCLKTQAFTPDKSRLPSITPETASLSKEAPSLGRLRKLPIYQRTAAVMIIVERLSYENASLVMDMKSSQIKLFVNEARKQLFD